MPSAYVGQERGKPITPTDAPGDAVRELFRRRAQATPSSRNRILICRDMRRGLMTCGVPEEWNEDVDVRKAVEVVLPERQTYGMDVTNVIGASEPVWTRKASSGNDRDIEDAEELEVFANAMRLQLVDWDEIIGKASEDGEFGVVVMPKPSLIEMRGDYMLTMPDGSRKPNPRYDRDENGRGKADRRYSGNRSSRASISAWRREYMHSAAANLPISARIIPATDCVPILQRGDGRGKYRTRGLIVRTLMEREDLISDGFTWDGMDKVALIPRGFTAGRSSGQNGQLYLYEAYLTHVNDEGEEIPFVAYCVGGWTTHNKRWGDETDSAVINLKEEYGLCRLPVGYFFGMHTNDDDFDYRGVPIMWPIVRHMLNKEILLTSFVAHVHANAFTGNVAVPAPNVKDEAWLEGGKLLKFKKPKANETQVLPGEVKPWSQATVSNDADRLLAEFTIGMKENAPDSSKVESGDPSGHALVVDDQLNKSAKRQLLECGQQVSEFIGEHALEQLCLLERGEWRVVKDRAKAAPVYVYQDVERVLDTGERRTVSEAIEFKERWVGNNYKVTAKYPREGNLAERSLLADLADRGYAKFAEVRESMGDEHPETSRVEIAVDRLFKEPAGLAALLAEAARIRGVNDQAMLYEQQAAGALNAAGFPVDALAPEFSGAGSPTQVPNMARNAANGAIQGQMGTAALQADAMGQVQAMPGVGLGV